MALPGITPAADVRAITERLAVLIRDYNRADAMVPLYAADSGSATAYVIAPIPGIKAYSVGQLFAFKATNANSGTTPTLAVNGLTAGTIKLPGGGAVAAGDIAAGGMTLVQVQDVTAGTPTFNLLNPCVSPANRFLQMVSTQTGAVASGTTTIPFDDTIPQNTEGDQYMSLAITPQKSTSTLIINVTAVLANSVDNQITLALFQDSTANALAAVIEGRAANFLTTVRLQHVMTSGTTSATTFKVRAGGASAGTTTFNGQTAARKLGGVIVSSIVIQEVLP